MFYHLSLQLHIRLNEHQTDPLKQVVKRRDIYSTSGQPGAASTENFLEARSGKETPHGRAEVHYIQNVLLKY